MPEPTTPAPPHLCPSCGAKTTYRAFSGGREWYCPSCQEDGSYEEGQAPRRVAMLHSPEGAAALREEMREHLAATPVAPPTAPEPSTCTCTGTRAGLNACVHCPTPWPELPGAIRMTRPEDVAAGVAAALANACRTCGNDKGTNFVTCKSCARAEVSRYLPDALANVHPTSEPYAYQPPSAFTWAESVASCGVGPTAQIDIDIHAPGHDEPVPVEIPLGVARTLHAMLGGLLGEHDEPAPGVAPCGNATGACSAGEWCCKGPDASPTCETGDVRTCTTACPEHGDIPATPAPSAGRDTMASPIAAAVEEMRRTIADVIDEGFRTFDADKTEGASLIESLTDSVLAFMQNQAQGLRAQLATARATNQRLNLRCQQAESQFAQVRRAVADWRINERGTYVPLSTLNAIAKAVGIEHDTDGWELHYQRVEALETAVADYENRIAWETTCGEHTKLLDSCRAADERAEEAEGAIARVRAQCDEWARPIKSGSWDAQIRDDIAASCAEMILAALTAPHGPAGQGDGGGQ